MTRFARLMAATMAALFTGALAAPAYATGGGGCDSHSALAPSATAAARRRARSSTTSTRTASATRASPASPASASGPTTTTTASTTPASPTTTPTRAAGTRSPASTRRPRPPPRAPSAHSKTYRLREKLASGSGTGDWTCSYPNASTSGGFATGNGSGFRCGHGPIDTKTTPKATGRDFGNYRKVKPKITVIKALVPSSDAGRFDLKVDGATVKAAAGDGGTGTTLVEPGHHQVTETAAAGTTLADYAASIACVKNAQERRDDAHLRPRLGRRHLRRRGRLHRPQRAPGHRRGREADRSRRDERHELRLQRASPAPSASPTTASRRSRASPRATRPTTVSENTARGYRLSSISCTDGDSTTSVANRTANIKVGAGEKVRCTFVNTKLVPGLQVVKDGPAVVHHGDTMTFTFAVSNTGNSPLRDVHVTDDHCDDVSAAPVERRDDDGDALLEGAEVWVFSCTMPVPAHATGEEDPVCNVATATGEDEEGTDVSASDDHCTDIIHPRIALDKTADRPTASVGDTIATVRRHQPRRRRLTVTRSRPRCDAARSPARRRSPVTPTAARARRAVALPLHPQGHRDRSRSAPEHREGDRRRPDRRLARTVSAEDSASVDLSSRGRRRPRRRPRQPAAQVQVLGVTQRHVPACRLRGASGCVSRRSGPSCPAARSAA